MSFEWPSTGDRVAGDYLGHAFEGVVTGVDFAHEPLGRRYAVRFDAPVEISKSKLMSNLRQNVRALIAPTGASIDAKGRPDGIMTLRRA
ncbi:glyoxalase superfamily protein [Phenylobacterium montanum]|uniref:Glyoxalase-related protein domain-containing protein n=1 Tax=Phenylobacterium montanum TaxID=2823693 RepID=A0A975FXF0_9CAUL|nr:glyoxalase superfamily protein [Caulobacter sp. S6]QUD87185.1 hypothetical protein KCG34_19320 [Caulobacter sp. S6]